MFAGFGSIREAPSSTSTPAMIARRCLNHIILSMSGKHFVAALTTLMCTHGMRSTHRLPSEASHVAAVSRSDALMIRLLQLMLCHDDRCGVQEDVGKILHRKRGCRQQGQSRHAGVGVPPARWADGLLHHHEKESRVALPRNESALPPVCRSVFRGTAFLQSSSRKHEVYSLCRCAFGDKRMSC